VEIINCDFTPGSRVGDTTTLVNWTIPPLVKVAIVAVIKPLEIVLPGKALLVFVQVLPEGSVWENTTPVAVLGPALDTVTI
jgi:hypothetical protein